ncbi:beta-lactamase-like protein [Nocardia neocaledoniensis NBRC 108232]|uniref:Alkyl sulfatase BDS1-like metallo-beta-lactamase superfamily hydrolase n=1 Tax=Nocardia neocaledoniensis TaxID=236511 RepID=A0A317NBQ0_9NOCA|nr:alkyl sulfatase dimerization domain-containing protein [Nocardia neocaledoniensis]PWV72736.1 alkyl sulfatase BDS1-like metallo-beta-lactamase superfamily hydrolase [Nocardia neocaledoniensis]GEM32591.1 beta-lactamase-like protein [Nocardia neocaledoniensis NBRC 108232]
MALDYGNRTDFDNADRGFIATIDPMVITNSAGEPVFDTSGYGYLDGERPETVHPSLFRQAQLVRKHGLYEVTDGIYQIRGFDLSNMTIVEGETGVIVIDPLISAETAAAGLKLYREHRGDRRVVAVIYTHSHVDHFGGVGGVLPDGRGEVPILAPAGFMAEAVSENVYAGNAMNRRAIYMYGYQLPISPQGQVSTGLGIRGSGGTIGLIPPTVDITHTGQQETLDGVRITFQLTPGTEAPSEMNFYFPDHRALCLAENATHNLHNLLTLRGAQVRDARAWSQYIDEAIELYGADAEVAFASHHWPTWGTVEIVEFLTVQRDLYMYLHDQTLRLLNSGLTGPEIAEEIELPPGLADAWSARGYYGSVSHNVKAIYQRYLGWFDGHPASLWQHPPQAAAERYTEALGGIDAVMAKATAYADSGDLRFAAELLKHAVFAEPGNTTATTALAEVFTKLGYGAENATWRSFYLTGAMELRDGIAPNPVNTSAGMAAALTVEQLFDTVAIRVNGPRAAKDAFRIDWRFTDLDKAIRLSLSNGVLIRTVDPRSNPDVDLTLTLTKNQLFGVLAGKGLDGVEHTGDTAVLARLFDLLDTPDTSFPIVTP